MIRSCACSITAGAVLFRHGRGYARPVRCCNVCPLAALRAGRGAGGRIADAQQQFFHFTQHLLAHLPCGGWRHLDAQPVHLPDELSLQGIRCRKPSLRINCRALSKVSATSLSNTQSTGKWMFASRQVESIKHTDKSSAAQRAARPHPCHRAAPPVQFKRATALQNVARCKVLDVQRMPSIVRHPQKSAADRSWTRYEYGTNAGANICRNSSARSA